MYKVIRHFVDLQDNLYEYRTGETFPREGLKVSKARFTELSTDKNKRGVPLIEEIEETPKRGRKKNA